MNTFYLLFTAIKEDALAFAMGVSQQTISNMENSENLDDNKLAEVAKALEVSIEAIKGLVRRE